MVLVIHQQPLGLQFHHHHYRIIIITSWGLYQCLTIKYRAIDGGFNASQANRSGRLLVLPVAVAIDRELKNLKTELPVMAYNPEMSSWDAW